MVAVIAGNGLGLLGTSLQQLGLGLGGNPGLGRSGASQYVNVATGNLVLQGQDERLVEQGFLSGVLRIYNSLGSTGELGGVGGWLLGLDRKLSPVTGTLNTVGSTITRTGSDGETELFTYDTSRGLYVTTNKSGAEDTLQHSWTGAWIFIAGGSGNQEDYLGNGRLVGLQDCKTGAAYDLTYDTAGRLLSVTANPGTGESLELGYDAQGRIATLSTVQIPAGGGTAVTESRVTYGYDASNRLVSVTTDLTPDDTTDASTFTTTYTYDGDSTRIASLTQSDGLVVSYTYAQDAQGNYRVATVTTGSGADAQTLTFAYDTADRTTTVTDASGRAWVYGYDAAGNLTSVTSPPVNGQYQVTNYAYTADGHLASVTDAEGHETIYEYDAHGNRVLERDADGNTTTWTYNADDQVLTRTVYQVPDPDGSDPGNLGQASDPSTTWYVYDDGSDGLGNTDQLRYVIDADGDVSEMQYNPDSMTQYGARQISMTRSFAGAAYDTSGLGPDTAPTLAAMNAWAAAQDLTQTTRVDYSYDTAGRLGEKTAWDQVDSSGDGVADAGESITTYVYDAQGLLRQQVTERGADRSIQDTTAYSYDGLGRLVGSTDALGHVTTYTYQAGGTLTVTYATGLVHTEVRNSAGELVTVTESATGQPARTTQYLYDEDGQLRATEAPDGAITYTFYDAAGRISGTVDAMGAVTQYVRDADGRIIETRQYATTADTSSWLSGGAVTASTPTDITAIVPTASANDRVTLSLYDDAGLHVADVDAEGNVTTYGYDGAGNRTVITQYATALSAAQLSALQGTPSWSTLQGDLASITSAADRVTRTFYDVANRAVATLDAAGYVTTTSYDAAGRIVKTTAYADGLSAAQLAALGSAPSLSAVLADVGASANDEVTRNYYDDRGQLVATVDAGGYLTTTTYDETTHAATSTRYAQAITADLTGQETLADLTGDVSDSPSQTSVQQYDADGNLISATAVDGTVTTYTYNAAGNLLGTTSTPPAGGQVRTSGATYDGFGDALTTTDGADATTTNVYNALGQKVQTTDALGNSSWYFYDADGRLVYTVKGIASGSTQNASGEVTAYAYDAFGEVVGTTRYAGRLDLSALGLSTSTSLTALATAIQTIANPAQDASSTTTYTLDGLTASIKDGLGYTTAQTYDAFGDLTSVQRQLSGAGQALSASNSTTTTYTYDARGERIGETDDAGGLNRTSGVTYDAFGRVTSRTDGNGNITSYSYDPLGRQISVAETVQGSVRTAQTTYDAYNRIVSQTDAAGQTTVYQYPDAHTVIVTTPDGVTLTTTRDAYGDTLSVTDGLGNTTHYSYDGDGRLLTTTDALGHVSSDAWDADGNLTSSTDANGVVTTYTYDAAGRVLTRTRDPGGLALTTTYAYDGRGQQVSVTDPNGVVTTYAYDAGGNVLTTIQDYGTGDDNLNLTTTYTWDGAGDQLSVTQGAGTSAARTTQYTYDKLGRLIQTVVDPGTLHLNLTTTYAYDANDNLIAKTDADGNVTRYVYNEANEQVYAIDAGGGVTQSWYDADGRVTSTRRYATALSATQLSGLGATPSITQVAGLVVANAADEVSYTAYNDDGQQAYTIDALGDVTATRYDAAGRISETLAYADALSASTLASLEASLQQGTALSSLAGAVGAGNTDQNAHATLNLYDADGHVRFVVQQDTVNGQLVGIVSEQRYDADGRVIAKVAYGTTLVLNTSESLADQLSTTSVQQALASATDQHLTQYVYDNAGRLRFTIDATHHVIEQQYDADGNLTQTLTYLNTITVPVSPTVANVAAAVSASNTTASTRFTSTLYDHAGRVWQTSDGLGGDALYTYDALGQKTSYRNRDGATWTYTYDQAGRLTQEAGPGVLVSSYGSGNTISTANGAFATQYTYDADGNVLSKTDAGDTSAPRTITYTYDSRGNQTKITYPGGTYASVTYDALGRAVVNRDVDGHHEYKVYDAAGELAYDVDGNGYVTAYSYDAYGNQTEVTRYATALGTSLTGAGLPLGLTQVQQAITTSSSDRTLTCTYDQLNRKLTVEQPAIAYVSDSGAAGGTKASPTTSYTYDAYGNVVATSVLVLPGSSPISATTFDYYDGLGRKTLEVDPLGYVTTWAYDAQGNVTQTTQYAKAISTSGLSTTTPPGLPGAGDAASGFNRTTTYTYDVIGRKASETDSGDYSSCVSHTQSIAAGSRTTSWTYDGEDRVTSVTVNGAKTSTTYDAMGRVLSVTQPARPGLVANWQALLEANPTEDLTWSSLYETASQVTTFTYDALGNALSSTTTTAGAAGGSQVSYSHYDLLGRVTSETDASGTTYNNTYDAAGNLLTTTYVLTGNSGSSTVTSTYTYDADNQRLSAVTKRGSTTESSTYVEYNAFGEIVAKGGGPADGGYQLTYQYDNAGNLISATDPKSGAQHSYQYDLRGNLVYDSTPVTGGAASVYVENQYDLDGRVVSQTAPSSTGTTGEGSAVTHAYDRWGNVISTTDARGYVTTYLYDSQNHLIKQTEPEVLVGAADGTRTWQTPTKAWYYDLNGNALGVTDENGNTTLNSYDAAGELTTTTDAVGAITRYAYDGLGNQVAKQTPITSTTSHITWSDVDALGRVIAKGDFLLDPSDNTKFDKKAQQTYVLDENGNRIQVTDALGNTSYYGYDSQGHMLSSQTPDQRAAGVSHTYSYGISGNKTSETDANGNTQTWSNDYYGRVHAHTDLSGASYTYTYDASSGLLTSETSSWNPSNSSQQTDPQSDPAYVPASNGAGTSSESYTYYADGQVKQITQKTGSATTTTTSYQYDAAGNETDENVQTFDGAGGTVDNDTQTGYDSHNRISEVTVEDTASGSAIMRTVYNYDAAGNRRAMFVQSGYGGSPINPGSGGPTATAIGSQTVQPGSSWSLDVAPHFTDTLGFGLTYTATGMPAWMQCNSDGVLSTSQSQQASGSYTVTVTATDVDGNSASTTVTVAVAVVDPVFPSFTPPSTSTGVAFSFSVPTATDANGSAITYAATWYNGSAWSSTLPSWIQFNTSTMTWSGTPLAGSAGTYKLAVSAYAANGGSASLIFNMGVSASPPVYHNSLTNQSGYETRSFSYAVPAGAFTEVDGGALSYSAGSYTMVGGVEQDSALPSWLSFNASTQTFSGTPPASTDGQTFNLYVKATNPDGQVAEGYFSLSILHYVQPAPIYHGSLTNHTGVIGGGSLSISLPSGAFTEPDGGALTYSAQVLIPAHILEVWNASHTEILDQNVPAQWVALSSVGLSISATTGKITGTPTTLNYVVDEVMNPYRYAHDTSYEIEIIATNGQAETAAGTFTLSNTYAPPAVLNPIVNPPAQNPGVYVRVVQDDTFSDPAGYGLTYSATLSNGAALPSGLTWSASSIGIGTVAAGTYTIKVTATDQGSASSTFTLTVNNVAPVFGAWPVNLTAVKGAAMTPYTAPAVTDPNGDAVSYSASNLPPGITFNTSTRTFSGTPTSTGTWTVTYKATDSHGAATSKTFTITVNAPAPQPPVYNGGIPSLITLDKYDRTYTIPSTAFSDPAGEALTYSVSTLPSYLSFSGSTRTFTLVTIPKQGEISAFTTLTVKDTSGRSITQRLSFDILGSGTVMAVPAGGTLDTQDASGTDASLTTDGTLATQQTTEQTTTPNIESYWFTYDADNRVEVSGGTLQNGQIVMGDSAGSVEKTYDLAGNVATELEAGYSQAQQFTYDTRGEMTRTTLPNLDPSRAGSVETRQYDADGRLIADVYTYAAGSKVSYTSPDFPGGNGVLLIGGWLSGATTYYYNADGEVYATFDYGRDASDPNYWDTLGREDDQGTLDIYAQRTVPTADEMPTVSEAATGAAYGVLTLSSHVSHWDPNTGTGGFDKEDNALVYTYSVVGGHTTTYRVTYLKKDGYLEASTTGTSDDPSVLQTTDTSVYDALGRRIAIDTHSAGQTTDQVRAFAYDAEGDILQRRDGSATGSTFTVTANGGYSTEHYAYVEGQQVGNVDEYGTINVLDGVTGFSDSETGTQGYVVQAGDTLASIAQQVYGDAGLWYVVADANGLTSDADLVAGQTLKLPEVTTNSNTAETFKPYNPREISGSTTPSLPQAPMPAPSAGHHCNTLAEIVVIAVVIVASIYTAGAVAEAYGAGAAGDVAIGTTAVSTTSTVATGATVLAGGGAGLGLSAGEAFAAAAIGGAAGSAAGQLAGDALGVHQGFSWGEVAGAALGAGITAGLAGEISDGQTLAQLHEAGGIANDARIAGVGAAGAIGNYAGEQLVGQPAHFSWANIAAAAIGTEATTALGLNSTLAQKWGQAAGGTFASNVVGGLVNGAIDSETARLLGGNAQNGRQIAEDAFGNALGNAAIAEIQAENARSQTQQQAQLEATAQQMQSSFSNELQGDIDAQTGRYIQSQMDAASTADFALMDAERGVITDGIAQYGTGYLAPLATMLNQSTAASTPMTQVSQSTLAEAGTPGFGTPNDVAYYDQNGVLNIPIVAHSGSKSGPSVYDAIENGVNNVVNGALSTAINMVYQPIAQVHDLGAVAYGLGYQAITGETYQPNWWSAIGQHADDDSFGTLAENVLSSNPVTGVGVAGWNIGTAIYNGDINSLETQAGGLLAGFAIGKAMAPDEASVFDANALAVKQKTAYSYYKTVGWNDARVATHMEGIDFSQPVDVVLLPKGTQVVQYQLPGTEMGGYFAPIGTPPEVLGINPVGREPVYFETTEDVQVLRSTAADTSENAKLPETARGHGGGTQYFTNNRSVFRPVGG